MYIRSTVHVYTCSTVKWMLALVSIHYYRLEYRQNYTNELQCTP